MSVKIIFEWVDDADTSLGLPSYETNGAAGADLRANLVDSQMVTLSPGERALIPTGLRIAIPVGFEVQIRPRSGLALKHGITLPNSPGTIDSDYRGAVGVILFNTSDTPFQIGHGSRIAQMVLAPVSRCEWRAVTDISSSDRGSGGFGSTGS